METRDEGSEGSQAETAEEFEQSLINAGTKHLESNTDRASCGHQGKKVSYKY